MDKIYIKDFEIFANHGVFESEKALGQKFIISLELFLNLRESGQTDDLTKSIHYGILMEDVEKFFTSQSFDLIETAVEKTCEHILLNNDLVNKVKINLKKPWAPVKRTFDYISIKMERMWHTVYVSGGCNLGNKKETLDKALEILDNEKDIKLQKVSNYYNTKPVGYDDQDDFMNIVFEIKTLKNPSELMDKLLEVEQVFKRERTIKNGPRTLDLDIIFFDDMVIDDEKTIIPHPRCHERQFVMKPMTDIKPYFVHPLLQKRIIDISNNLGDL
ncbi:MAG: 2-amino-4-hydroxy-6-hydroxymethyldihydropteridine diphosphokinase [Peptostreptococcaceae bacterium]